MHFVLIHGMGHGGWCWEQTQADLEAQGHTVQAPDLPLTSLEDDVALVTGLLEARSEPCVLVGHSYGGLVIAGASADRSDVRALVYVAAVLVSKDVLFTELSSHYPTDLATVLTVGADGQVHVDPESAAACFYQCCPDDVAARAVPRLRPSSVASVGAPAIAEPSTTIPSTYVVCLQDKAIAPALQQEMAQRATRAVELDTDHSPFYSEPEALRDVLLGAASA
ncbi:MAG: alpha/beta fold hydrolase [Pseudomonadota bacterium]